MDKFVHKVVKDYDAAVIGLKAGELDVLGLPMEKFILASQSGESTREIKVFILTLFLNATL